MQRVILLCILVVLGLGIVNLLRDSSQIPQVDVNENSEPRSPQPMYANTLEIPYQSDSFKLVWFTVSDLQQIQLRSNLLTPTFSQDLIQQSNCQYLINGGFYSETNKPIGWLVSESKEVSPSRKLSVYNGFFYVNQNNQAVIAATPASGLVRFGLQAGPLLIQNGQPKSLKNTGNTSRRMTVSLTESGEIIFAAVYRSNNPYQGPTLSELPSLLQTLGEHLDTPIQNSLNLDGGIHSAFYAQGFHLEEIDYLGSYFCVS